MKTSRKKIIIVSFGVLIIGLGLFFFLNRPKKVATHENSELPKSIPVPYDTLERKAKTKAITVRPSTSTELKFIALKAKATRPNDSKTFMREDRLLAGDEVERFADTNVFLPTLNRPAKDWKEKLGHELLRFQPEGVKVALAQEQSYIQIDRGKGRYVELVVVNYLNPKGGNRAYHALVDSQTGVIIDTWDRTQMEFRKPFIFTQHRDN